MTRNFHVIFSKPKSMRTPIPHSRKFYMCACGPEHKEVTEVSKVVGGHTVFPYFCSPLHSRFFSDQNKMWVVPFPFSNFFKNL